MSGSLLDRTSCQDCRAPLWFTGTYVIKTEQGVSRKLCENCFRRRSAEGAANQGDRP